MDLYQIIAVHNRPWSKNEIFFFSLLFCLTFVGCLVMVRKKKIGVGQMVTFLIGMCYLAIVFASTVFTRAPGVSQHQLEVFWSWKEIFGIGGRGRLGGCAPEFLLQENILNMILLFPIGFLLPFIRGRKVAWKWGILVGCVISGKIEVLQLVLCRGLFEFDDVIHNSVGCMIGCAVGNIGYYLIGKISSLLERRLSN